MQAAIAYAILSTPLRKVLDSALIMWGEEEAEIWLDIYCPVRQKTLNIHRTIRQKGSSLLDLRFNEQEGSIQYATVNDGNNFILEWIGISSDDLKSFYILNKENYKSFVASFIHRSSVILLALLFLAMINIPLNNKFVNIAAVVVCLVIGSTPYWITMNSGGVSDLLVLLGYDHYSMTYEEMVEMADFRETAFGPLRLMTLFVDLCIIWFYPKIEEVYSSDKALGPFFQFFFFGVCAYNLFANTNILFLRPVEYLTIFRLPMTAYLLCYLKRANKTWFVVVCFFVFTYTLVEVLKSGLLGVKETNLYHFFFFQ